MSLLAHLFVAALPGLLGTPSPQDDALHWAHWRGPARTGMVEASLPLSWSQEENLRWQVDLPGRGCSTPVIVGQRLFVTTAVPVGDPEAVDLEGSPDGRGELLADQEWPEQDFIVLALDRKSGKQLWRQTATRARPTEGYHRTYGSYASASPVSDGERLYALFGSRGVFCYDLTGELLWKRDFGLRLETRRGFGAGTSPVLFGDALLLNFDHEGQSLLICLDKLSGEERWRVERDEVSTWAEPLPLLHEGQAQVVLSGTKRVRCYAIADGELLWECAGLGLNCIPAPVRAGDDVLLMSGYRSPNLICVRLGGKGDLTGTQAIRWSSTKGSSYTASPLLDGEHFYALQDSGFMSCFDVRSGEPHYLTERLPRGLRFKASPLGAAGRLYLLSESGEVVILRMGPQFEVLDTIESLEAGLFVASPAAADGQLFLRSLKTLYCIGSSDAH